MSYAVFQDTTHILLNAKWHIQFKSRYGRKNPVPNKWLKYLIFLGASYSEHGEFKGSSESFISYIWDFFTYGAVKKSHHWKSLKMNYQISKQPREGFIFKTGMIIADISATTWKNI